MANQQILSFICVEPRENGNLTAIFRFLAEGEQGSIVELSKLQIEKRISDYKGGEGLITNFDSLPQFIEFKKALKEMDKPAV